MSKRQKVFAVLPTLLTLGNAACGFGAITFAAKVGPEIVTGNELLISLSTKIGPESVTGNELFIAGLLIFIAMLFDMLDGSAARWTRQVSDFGAQLDSLCDAISFGVAPAFLMLQFTQFDVGVEDPFIYPKRLLWVIAVLFVLCTLLRLARFNVETDEEDSHDFFSGLPSPAAAGAIASFPIGMHGLRELAADPNAVGQELGLWLIPAMKIFLPVLMFLVACLMVSRIRYAHYFNQLFTGQRNRQHLIQLVFTIALVFLVREMAIPVIFCYFAFASPLRTCWTEILRPRLVRSKRV